MIIRPCGVSEPAQAQCHLAHTGIGEYPYRRCGCSGDRRGVAVRGYRACASLLFVWRARVWVCDGVPHRMGFYDFLTVWCV
jgi:hypothetical protein